MLLWTGFLVCTPAFSQGVDTVTLCTYNLLNYQQGNSSRDAYYRTVLGHVEPDILVVQEIASPAGLDSFHTRVLNAVFPGQFTRGIFLDGPDTDNGILFRTGRFTFLGNRAIRTALRDINEFTLFHPVSAETLRVYSVHLKASNTASDRAKRAAEVDSLRRVTNLLRSGSNFLVTGDFNMYASTESAYVKLLADDPWNDGHALDAVTLPGTWNTPAYAAHHTQSTRLRSLPDGGSTGGLDDRFDLILYSRGLSESSGAQILPSSIVNVGNDGAHYDDSVSALPNASVPPAVAHALHYASDHIPVTASILFRGPLAPPAAPALAAPSDGATGVPLNPVLSWRRSAGATSYRLQAAVDSLFASVRVDTSGMADTVAAIGPLERDRPHFWRVAAVNAAGQGSFSPSRRFRTTTAYTYLYAYGEEWNLVSLPLDVSDPRPASVFPQAISNAYRFEAAQGYVAEDSLREGAGYWLKFDAVDTVAITGNLRPSDTLQVAAGWNLMGSVSDTVPAGSVASIPPGIILTEFYEFNGSYIPASALLPGRAYWVKTSSEGFIVLHP
ncbi:MAG: endonuclease/exonuclease/phosphatase family protein [Bacteroidota bacterium]